MERVLDESGPGIELPSPTVRGLGDKSCGFHESYIVIMKM